MRWKDIRLKFKGLRLRRLLIGEAGGSRKVSGGAQEPLWMTSISHGYHVVEGRTFRIDQSSRGETDIVVVQREQIGNLELWFYGVSDAKIGKQITRYMQSHFFDRKPNEYQITRKIKEALKKAYLNARAELRESTEGNEKLLNVGSASVMVISGEKLVIANMGDYKAVVCRDGVAHQLGTRHRFTGKRHWPRRFLSGVIRMPRVRIQACSAGKEASARSSKSSELASIMLLKGWIQKQSSSSYQAMGSGR
ncbi:hypothetical protein Ancab_030184 [Ancistrocladus abbreviatus]